MYVDTFEEAIAKKFKVANISIQMRFAGSTFALAHVPKEKDGGRDIPKNADIG